MPSTRLPRPLRLIALWLVLATILLATVACAATPTGTGTDATPTPGGKKPTLPASEETTNLVYYVWGSDSEFALTQEIVDDFNAANPKVLVEIERSGGDYFGMLRTRYAGGNEPDVFLMDPGEVGGFLREDLLLPLDDFFAGSTLKPEDLWSVNDLYRYDGTRNGRGDLYALIKDWSPDFMMFYNKSHLDEAGIAHPSATEPMTWAEFLAMAKKLTQRNTQGDITRYGTMMDFVPYKHLLEYVQMAGSSLYEDGGKAFNRGDAGVLKAFQYFVDLQKGPDAPAQYSTGAQASGSGERFAAGTVSVVWFGRWAYPSYAWDKVGFDVGVAPPPVPEKGMKATAGSSGMIAHAISVNTRSPQAAWAFLDYYMTVGEIKVADTGFNIPGNKTIAKDRFQNVADAKVKELNRFFLDAAENYTFPVQYSPLLSTTRVESLLSQEISLVFEDRQTLDEALAGAADAIDDALSQAQ